MSAYFNYLGKLLTQFFKDFAGFFYHLIVCPWGGHNSGWPNIGYNFKLYNDYLKAYSPEFGPLGWIMWVLFLLIAIGAIGGACFGLFLLIKKYVKFAKTELDKDALKRQVERLNYELYDMMKERDKILELKMKSLGIDGKRPPEGEMTEEEQTIDEIQSRFPKLAHVDFEYNGKDMSIPEVPDLTLAQLCENFRNFAASQMGLYYTIDTVRHVIAGIGAGKIVILEGISGTGKTSMPYALGKFFKNDANICSVQPNWKDRSELLGYYNEFTKKFNESEFLRALYTTIYRRDVNLIVLDEMNLARVEYYFAEFLSILEMPNPNEWNIELIGSRDPHDPKLFKNGKIKIPQNVFFFGTANNDDSTFTISDKVYDRAICLFFDNKGIAFEAPFQGPMEIPYEQLQHLYDEALEKFPVSEKTLENFALLDDFVIKKFRLAFGNRILKQLKQFVPCFVACGGTELDGIDFIFTNKILKKFESLNIGFLKQELKELNQMLDKLFGTNTFPMARGFIDRMIRMN